MKQTAVEWLESMLVIEILTTRSRKKKIVKNLSFEELSVLLQQAKEMEKEQIIDFAKKFSDFNGLTFNEKEVSKEYLEKLYLNKISKTKKCDWCNKRKTIDNGYYIGKLESSISNKENFICVDCNLQNNIV